LIDLLAPFLIGFMGSLHCLGMCGPLVLAYSIHLNQPGQQATSLGSSPASGPFLHHLFFHVGRILSYGFLGGLAAGVFYLADLKLFFNHLRGGLTLFGGILIVIFGLALLKAIPLPFPSSQAGTSRWSRVVRSLYQSPRLDAKMALGLATGFLPCGLSWAMIAKAATTHSLPLGFLTMVAFGLGTVPALFATGVSASFLSIKVRILGEKIAALSLIAMGLVLITKGGRIFV